VRLWCKTIVYEVASKADTGGIPEARQGSEGLQPISHPVCGSLEGVCLAE
jgi:hypothetical protein